MPGQAIGTWFGVTVNASGCVIEINLNNTIFGNGNNLTGNLPAEIGALSELKYLDLGFNNITGNIPSTIGSLTNLEVLFLRINKFKGEIPGSIGNLINLTTLNLSVNELSGIIPDEIGQLIRLKHLSLGANYLHGVIPASYKNLIELESLDLSQNYNLFGTIPSFLGGLTNLKVLSLGINSFSENIPSELGNLNNLEHLNLSANYLTGTVPISFKNLQKLKSLVLFDNMLSGPLPYMLGELPDIEYLLLQENRFTGKVPDFIGNKFRALRIDYNKFEELGNYSHLNALDTNFSYTSGFACNDNRLSFDDILPNILLGKSLFAYAPQDSFFKDTVISGKTGQSLTINLEIDTDIADNVYNWYRNGQPWQTINGSNVLNFNSLNNTDEAIYHVQVTNPGAPDLTLYSRAIKLEVSQPCNDSLALVQLFNATGGPNWLARDNWLQPGQPLSTWYGVGLNAGGCVDSINLSGNRLSGDLPQTILNMEALRVLDLSENQLTGNVEVLLGNTNAPALEYLWLQRNLFSGALPDPDLPKLEALTLDSNQIAGIIPDFQQMPNLRALSLEFNQLEGNIPDFSGLPRLQFLILSRNPLTGVIPDFHQTPDLERLVLIDCDLSGTMPDFKYLQKLRGINAAMNRLEGAVPEFKQSPLLDAIVLRANRLAAPVPDYQAHLPLLRTLFLENNRLTFEHILPAVDANNTITGYNYLYDPQDSVFQDLLIEQPLYSPVVIDLEIDPDVPDNRYAWFKDSQPWTPPAPNDIHSNRLIFDSLQTGDAGVYHVQVTNPGAPELTLFSRAIEISVLPESEARKNSNVLTPNDDAINDVFDPVFDLIQKNEPFEEDELRLLIYNRWGNLVFSAKPYQAWRGTADNGEPVPQEVYYYYLRTGKGKKDFKRGTLTVLR